MSLLDASCFSDITRLLLVITYHHHILLHLERKAHYVIIYNMHTSSRVDSHPRESAPSPASLHASVPLPQLSPAVAQSREALQREGARCRVCRKVRQPEPTPAR